MFLSMLNCVCIEYIHENREWKIEWDEMEGTKKWST